MAIVPKTDKKSKETWDTITKVAEEVKNWPAWKTGKKKTGKKERGQ